MSKPAILIVEDEAIVAEDLTAKVRHLGYEVAGTLATGEEVLVNELNTMPGFTPTSVYAKLMHASGVAYPTVVDTLCRLGCERSERRARLRH